jgi:serine/threonine protein kinase
MSERQIRDKFYDEYIVGAEIGKGGFGTIFNGLRKRDNKLVAIKVIKKNRISQWYEFAHSPSPPPPLPSSSSSNWSQTEMDSIYEMEYDNRTSMTTTIDEQEDILITKRIPLEIALMIRVRSVDNCIKILDYLEQKHCFVIVMERFENSTDLFDFITDLSLENSIGLNEELAREFFKYVISKSCSNQKMYF